MTTATLNGGEQIATVLERQGVRFLFTLCGGHISPILVGCKARGIRIVDVRDEANAVFAADGVARLTGVPGVAAVTAGPGVTNTLTAVKNAQMAQSPVVLLGGAAATMLRGKGSLQDIDQMAVIRAHVKWAASASSVRELVPKLEQAFREALSGVPGPVFVECPIDLLYGEELVRTWYVDNAKGSSLGAKGLRWYLGRHVDKLFRGADRVRAAGPIRPSASEPMWPLVAAAARTVSRAERPVVVVGSQALTRAAEAHAVAAAVEKLGVPVYLTGMARGLLGKDHPLQLRHKRGAALKEADVVVLAGVPCDFRMGYGRSIGSKATLISANLCRTTLFKNRVPKIPILADPGRFLQRLAEAARPDPRWGDWLQGLRARDIGRNTEIDEMSLVEAPPLNPIAVCQGLDRRLPDDSVLVADGGDFVATAAYTVQPRGPLRWLDPGVFGTLGVGAGFALAAALVYPEAETWLIYGDGAAGFSLIELDTFVRHGLPVIALVGNDAGWTQIARDQVVILEDDVGTVLARTDYDKVAQGFGAVGIRLDSPDRIDEAIAAAQAAAREGKPVLINAHIGKTDFRKGSISM